MTTIPTLSNTELHEAIGQTCNKMEGRWLPSSIRSELEKHLKALLKERQRRAVEHLPIELAR